MNPAEDMQEEGIAAEAQLRAIPTGSIRKTLEAHQTWVRSRGREGSRADLSGADLGRANLRVAVLVEANLQGADLDRAILEGARMQRVDLRGASLRGASLQRASMQQANLQGADLFEAILEAADLSEANLQAVNFLQANLREADLQRANLQRAFLKESVLQEANLRGANLSGANLQEADLHGAELQRTILRETNLAGTNLRGADLQGADLYGSNLQETDLQQSYLRDVNLRGTTGLVASQLAGADLGGAKLPAPIRAFTGVATVRALTKQARHLFALILLGCFVSWLCLAATTDARLLTNASLALFPELPLPIPSAWFYKVMPILLLGLYIYFHLHLQRLWEDLAALPAVFPDGRPVDRVVYPWLLHAVVRIYTGRLRGHRPPLFRTQAIICGFLAWWLVPITLLLFWARYLPCHTWGVTMLHIAMFVIAAAFMVLSQNLARNTLRVRPVRRYRNGAVAITIAVVINVGLSVLSLATLTGVPSDVYSPGSPQRATAPRLPETDLRRLIPHLLHLLDAHPFANLVEAEVSQKLAPLSEQTDRLDLIKGARLQKANLRYAKARGAFLVNADLRGAILTGADLRQADLRGAQLAGTDLRGAVLYGADLRYTKDLTQNQISTALIDAATRLPDTLRSNSQPKIDPS